MKLSFSTITYEQLRDHCSVVEKIDDEKFSPWLGATEKVSDKIQKGLDAIITRCRRDIESFSEEEVKMKIIGPLLQLVNFPKAGIEEWYERSIEAVVNDVTLSGQADCIIAKGDKSPELPYFFLQEYKPNFSNRNPEIQLVAEMVASLSNYDKAKHLLGSYVVGAIWNFVLVEKDSEQFRYFVSPALDSMNIEALQTIFLALQKVKHQTGQESLGS